MHMTLLWFKVRRSSLWNSWSKPIYEMTWQTLLRNLCNRTVITARKLLIELVETVIDQACCAILELDCKAGKTNFPFSRPAVWDNDRMCWSSCKVQSTILNLTTLSVFSRICVSKWHIERALLEFPLEVSRPLNQRGRKAIIVILKEIGRRAKKVLTLCWNFSVAICHSYAN